MAEDGLGGVGIVIGGQAAQGGPRRSASESSCWSFGARPASRRRPAIAAPIPGRGGGLGVHQLPCIASMAAWLPNVTESACVSSRTWPLDDAASLADTFPAGRGGTLRRPFKRGADALEDLHALARRRPAVSRLSARTARFGVAARRQTADGILQHVRDLRPQRQRQHLLRLGIGDRLQAVPVHQRQVVVGGILGMSQQCGDDGPPVRPGMRKAADAR